ncbi:MAG: hydantoin racemase [Firmicutes bacterium]|nr:hydantoin racemase [Bacillota bacterium]
MLNLHGRIIEQAYPSLEVTSRCITAHPEGVHDELTEGTASPLVVELALAFEHEGFDAVVVSCAGDPGVEGARQKLRIPVIGAGEATAALALGFGGRVGALGITAEVPAAMRAILRDSLVSSARPAGVYTTLDLLTEEGRASVNEAALSLKREGARVIALACTGLSTIGAASAIRAATGLRVIDPVIAEGLFAYHAVSF